MCFLYGSCRNPARIRRAVQGATHANCQWQFYSRSSIPPYIKKYILCMYFLYGSCRNRTHNNCFGDSCDTTSPSSPSRWSGSNRRPTVYKTVALPTELHRQKNFFKYSNIRRKNQVPRFIRGILPISFYLLPYPSPNAG